MRTTNRLQKVDNELARASHYDRPRAETTIGDVIWHPSTQSWISLVGIGAFGR
jgi:hypothetical protein